MDGDGYYLDGDLSGDDAPDGGYAIDVDNGTVLSYDGVDGGSPADAYWDGGYDGDAGGQTYGYGD